jgi:hypothetical protein
MRVLFNKSRNIFIFVVITVLLAFSGTAFAHVNLLLKAPTGVTLDATGLTLAVFQGTGNQEAISADTSSPTQRLYLLPFPGTYNYRVTSNPSSLFYGVSKLLHFTQDQIDNNVLIEMEVLTGVRPTGTETFDAASVSVFTDQILNKLFGTANLRDFPTGGLQTPVFTTTKGLWQHSTQADLMKLVTDVANSSPNIHLFSLGKAPAFGYDIPVLIFTTTPIPAGATFEQAAKLIRENNKVTFFYEGQIHGGEVSSGEGAMAFILEMAGAYGAKFLDKVDVVCVPRFNVEGAARNTRTSVATVIDMNRDHLRTRAPEVRMVHKAYLEVMPEFVMDGHEIGYYTASSTNTASADAYATGGITDLESTPSTSMNNPSMELNEYALNTVANKLHADLASGGIRSNHYENGSNGWTCNHGIARAYYGLMGSVSFLVEVRGGGTHLMARRAWAHVLAAKSLLESLYANDVAVKALVKKGRDDTIAKGKKFDPNEKIFLYQYASGATAAHYAQGTENPGSKYSNYKLMRHQADMLGNLVKVNSTDNNMVDKTLAINDTSHFDRARPTAYVIPKGITNTTVNSGDYAINYAFLLEMLQANRLEYYELSAGTSAPLRQYYRVSGTGSASGSYNPTINNNFLRADLRPEETVTFNDGAYVIPMDQVTGSVIMCTFEPDIANSNAFNGTVTQSLPDSEGLALIFHDSLTNNYPYYRFEGDDPRKALSDENCKEKIKEVIKDKLEEICEEGCNAGFGILVFAIFAFLPFARKK